MLSDVDMSETPPREPWRVIIVAIAGLLAAIAIAGVVTLGLVVGVNQVTDRALRYDIELEDRGDDFRVAVLDVRQFHRNLVFGGPSRGGVADFESAFATLREEIIGLAELGVDDPSLPTPEQLEKIAAEYYDGFRPAIDLQATDRSAFTAASDLGLIRLEWLGRAAEQIDRRGEARAAAALASVYAAGRQAIVVLVAVLVGLGMAAAGLGFAALRVLRELRRLNAAQQESAGQLRAALVAKSDFIADASHELRTPLTVLRGNAEVGLAMSPPEDLATVLAEIVKESARMTKLIEDLLLLARSDAATLELEPKAVEVEPWLAELAARAEMLARERGATFKAELHARGNAWVDARRFDQAVLILIDNAAKYGRSGGLIALRTMTQDGRLLIAVTDDGPGIPDGDLPHIFERFYRVDKTRARSLGGAGLGLPIARTIVEAHGGRIIARSQVGEGTTMTIELPLTDGEPRGQTAHQVAADGSPAILGEQA